jgi:hypothetical protein
MAQHEVKLGSLITEPEGRDAIHIAVAPVVAADDLGPGEHVGIMPNGMASAAATPAIGIVDPFLSVGPSRGERFWLCLYPNTITSLRHEWVHPAFVEQASDAEASRKWLEDFASQHYSHRDEWYSGTGRNYTADELVEYARDFLLCGEKHVQQGSESLRDNTIPVEFWGHFEAITGMKVPDYHRDETPFCCTC